MELDRNHACVAVPPEYYTRDPFPQEGRLDYGKPRPDLLPVDALLAVSAVMATGVEKHGARTWEAGRPWGGEYGAILRHLWAWWGGQENDPDTGLPHLAHAAARVLMLLAMTKRRVGVDERSSGGG